MAQDAYEVGRRLLQGILREKKRKFRREVKKQELF